MKLIRWLLLIALVSPVMAQNVRWDLPITTTQAQGGNLLPLYAIPGALVSFYNEPAGTLANTYNSATSVSACPTSAQVVLNGSASCVSSADPFGNMGAWFLPGQYMAKITALGQSYNYFFTIGGSGGGSGSVTSVSVATANGFQGAVANPTTTPAISVNVDSTHVLPVNTGATTNFLNQAGSYSVPAGSNPLTTKGDLFGFSTVPARVPIGADGTVLTADSTQATGVRYASTGAITTLMGDVMATGPGVAAATLATVNGSPGTCGDSTHVCQVTTNGKGLTTTQTPVAISGGGGAVSSVSNSDSTLTVTPTTGAVVASLNLGHANTWTAPQTFAGSGPPISIPSSKPCTPTTATGQICTDSSGNLFVSENNGAPARVCDATNAVCGGQTNPATCTASVGSYLCITTTPYFGYRIQPVITQTSGTFGIGTSGSVVSCTGVLTGATVSIPGAGTQGSQYTGTVSSCSGTTLTISPTTVVSVGSGTFVLSFTSSTTTSGTFGVGTSGSVTSCALFTVPGQGVFIAGAGSSADYIGSLVSCNGTTLTITPATSTSVGGGTVVQPDNTAAILAAYTTAHQLGYATVYFPDGLYLVNGPLLDGAGANAVLPMPKIPNYTGNVVYISMRGFTKGTANEGANTGAIIQTSNNSANFIGGFDSDSGGGEGPFTNVWLDMEDLELFSTIDDPNMKMVNAQYIVNFSYRDLQIASATTGIPANTAASALILPALGDQVRCEGDGTYTEGGFYNGLTAGEHCNLHSVRVAGSHDCLRIGVPNSASFPNYVGNTTTIQNFWSLNCPNFISATSIPAVVSIQAADLENNTGIGYLDVDDPNGYLTGVININKTFPPHCGIIRSGGNNLQLNPLQCMPMIGGSGAPAGLIENWVSQEGTGTTLHNTGSDSTNTATTNATWASAPGFTGLAATYNGTSSVSTATSFTNTNFDGTVPFSACVWYEATDNSSTQMLLSTLTASTGNAGWRMDILPSGINPEVYLINNVGTSNFINVQSNQTTIGPGGLILGIPHLGCFTYDGSKTGAGVQVYEDAIQSQQIVTDGLTGSTVSATPVYIGGEAPGDGWFTGSIVRARIFNRVLTPFEIQTMYLAGPCIGASCGY